MSFFLWILFLFLYIQYAISEESTSIVSKNLLHANAVGTNEGITVPTKSSDPDHQEDTTFTSFPKVHEKIDHVEDQLHILQEVEQSLAQSIDNMNREVYLKPGTKRNTAERQRLSRELNAVRNNLKKLAAGLSGTLEDLVEVEKENDLQAKKLNEVLEKQKEDEQEEFLEKHGIDAVDYETGHLRNTSGLTSIQVKKLEEVEKNADPAVSIHPMIQ
jgi:septal ring factor EnvC (AmiA/AmiB activator)